MAYFQGKSGIGIYGNDYYIKNNFIQLADRLQKKVNRSIVPLDTTLPLKGAKMEKREMKEEVYRYICKNCHVTYAELQRLFERNAFEFRGNLAQGIRQYPHVFFWFGWNEEAIDIIYELEDEGKIHKVPSSALIYLIDGCVPSIPAVKNRVNYKTDHWCPVAFAPGKGTGK